MMIANKAFVVVGDEGFQLHKPWQLSMKLVQRGWSHAGQV